MEFVTYEQDGFVGIITINRPKALNALNSQVLEELDAAFSAVDLDKTRAVILTGAGEKSFVAGADIGEMSTLTKAEGEAFGKKGNDILRKMGDCVKRAYQAGVDVIEVHGDRLVGSLCSTILNHRQDQYGGSFENRILE